MKALGDRVVALRLGLELTQEELARRLGCTISTLSRIERGIIPEPSGRILRALVNVLGLDLSDGPPKEPTRTRSKGARRA